MRISVGRRVGDTETDVGENEDTIKYGMRRGEGLQSWDKDNSDMEEKLTKDTETLKKQDHEGKTKWKYAYAQTKAH